MKTYERLPEVGSVNLLFDQAMYSLHDDLARITRVIGDAGVPYEVIEGVAVLAHILDRNRSRSFVTRDIDLLIRREDLGRLAAAADAAGYQARKIVGGYMIKDQLHLETLDETGLITEALEAQLPEVLRERLAQARRQWLAEKPDVEEI